MTDPKKKKGAWEWLQPNLRHVDGAGIKNNHLTFGITI